MTEPEPIPETPASLYALAAKLVGAGVVELDALYAHLSPADDAAVERHVLSVETRLAAAKKIGAVNLLAKADDSKSKDADPLTVAITPPNDPRDQKLGLVRGFLAVGDVDGATAMIERLRNLGLDPAEDPAVQKALCETLRNTIAECYGLAAPATSGPAMDARGPTAGMEPPDPGGGFMPDEAFERLRLLGPYVAVDPVLHSRMIRCVRHHFIAAASAGDNDAGAKGEEAMGFVADPRAGVTPREPRCGVRDLECSGTPSGDHPVQTLQRLEVELRARPGLGARNEAASVRSREESRGAGHHEGHAPPEQGERQGVWPQAG